VIAFIPWPGIAPGATTTWLIRVAPIGLVAGCALFTVRGYALETDAILVQRLLWATRIPLEGLEEIRARPDAMRRSIRLWGNGGFFSFTGWFWNKNIGKYRAYVTDPTRAVVLRFTDQTIVMSPDDPVGFVNVVSQVASVR
jgi:hypothetical protein